MKRLFTTLESYTKINNSIRIQTTSKGGPKMAELNLNEEKQRCLARIGVLGYTLGNYLPQECTWRIGKRETIEIIARHSQPYLDDIVDITLYGVKQSAMINNHKETVTLPAVYIWLPKKSHNLVDQNLKNLDTAIPIPSNSPSEKLQEYAKKFGENGKLNLIGGKKVNYDYENERNMSQNLNDRVGFAVTLDRFLQMEFDSNNYEYGKMFGNEFKRKTDIRVVPEFRTKPNGLIEVEKLNVTKYIITNVNVMDGTTVPRNAHNIR